MPKLARREYDEKYYRYSSYTTGMQTAQVYSINERQTLKRRKTNQKRKAKKFSFIHFLISLSLLAATVALVFPYSIKHITKSVFEPIPYKHIQTDMKELAYPIHNYLTNSWFMGHHSFRFAAEGKKAQMIPMKENHRLNELENHLLYLGETYPTVKPAVYVWDYETGNYVDINANKIYATASIIKIPVLVDLFKSIEAGQVSLDDTMNLTEYFRTEGSGSLQFKARDSVYSIDKLAEVMITESDNSATNMLMAKIGSMTDVNQAIRDWGLKNTEVQTWLPDYRGTNKTTAREMADILYNIDSNDKFLSQNSRAKILDYMAHVHNNRLIQAGLGPGAVFYHKTGDIGTMLGDAGIVIAPNGKKYIVVILANRPHNSVAGKEYIVKASEIIYSYMVR